MIIKRFLLLLLAFPFFSALAQNSLVGDGFGGRLWYKPYNYSVGSYSGYTVCSDSFQLYGWGQNQYGQLGNGNTLNSRTPVIAQGMTRVKFYSCGYIMSVIKCDSTGWAWGKTFLNPTPIVTNARFTDAGSHSVSFVKYDGTVWSIGANTNGEFGNGATSTSTSFVPEQMKNVTNAVRVANGYYVIAVLTADGKVKTCGSNVYGGLGKAGSPSVKIPVAVDSLHGIVDIKAIDYTLLALDSAGDVYQWGKRVNSSKIDSTPQKIYSLKNIVAISGCDDGDHFLALDSSGNCYGWGIRSSTFGGGFAVGGNDTPTLVATHVVDILAGELFSYIIKEDGSMWAAGTGIPIWMNLKDSLHLTFAKINPTDSPMYLCGALPFRQPVVVYDSMFVCRNDSILFNNHYYKPDTTLRDSILGGPCSVDTIKVSVITQKYFFRNYPSVCIGDTVNVGIHRYAKSGDYFDTLTSIRGCDSIIYTKLKVNPKYNDSLFLNICDRDSVVIGGVTHNTSGVFFHALQSSMGCDSFITLHLKVFNSSFATLKYTLCFGETIIFNNKKYSVSGTYTDTLHNAIGCDSIVTLQLSVIPKIVNAQSFRICSNESVKIGSTTYRVQGDFVDTLKSTLGCDSILLTHIEVKKVGVLQLRDTVLCEDKRDVIHLDAGDYKAYIWHPGGETSREISVTKAGVYSVIVTTLDSCDATDSILVRDSCSTFLLIPNVFTVNNDGLNDAFDIDIKGEDAYDLKIFNRWGMLVYESQTDGEGNDGNNWNGTFFNQGKECPAGVYYMVFHYHFPGYPPGSHKGDVTLIRK